MADLVPPGSAPLVDLYAIADANRKVLALIYVFTILFGVVALFLYDWYRGPLPTSSCWEEAAPKIPAFLHHYWRDIINEGCLAAIHT